MPEPADRRPKNTDSRSAASVHGELEPAGEVRHLPVVVPVPAARTLDRATAQLPAPVVAATGGFLAGVATFVAMRMLGRRRSSRTLVRGRPKGGRELEVLGSRSFLVDVHLIRR